ncbi:hypothetical protein RD110_18625 [Rhodoferax koreense]|uniref:Uncharacterized protein n=1 Tax=Rhodoferax koreensis TaxID=1842727 RepID=A0A1P8JYZ2_9BURK|nr:hypothetical protein RD110_18625 [Rhodoferax koreense]
MVLAYAGFTFSAAAIGDVACAYDKTITGCSIEYPLGQINRVTFGGANGILVPGGVNSLVYSDQVLDSVTGKVLKIPAGAKFIEHVSYTRSDGGTTWDMPQEVWNSFDGNSDPNLGEYSNYHTGADASQTAFAANPYKAINLRQAWGACGIFADGVAPFVSVLIDGDSIATGSGGDNTTVKIENTGYVARGLGSNVAGGSGCVIPYMRMTCPQASLDSSINSQGSYSLMANGRVTHVIQEMLINNVFGSNSFEMIQSKLLTQWLLWRARGVKVIQCTALPATDSTDGWATVANQTVRATEAVRVKINDWIRTVPWPLEAVFDAADRVEVDASGALARNGGRWIVSLGQPTPDGTHPSPVVAAAAAAAIDKTKLFL